MALREQRSAKRQRRLRTESLPRAQQFEGITQEGVFEGVDEDPIEAISDTLAAIYSLRSKHPPQSKAAPLVLRSHIYTLLSDHTAADRELEEERHSCKVRIIKLPASVDDYAYLLQEDYQACIEEALLSEKEQGKTGSSLEIFRRFRNRVVPECMEASISHHHLLELLDNPERQACEQQVALLLGSGLLTRQVGSLDSYLFAVPGAGRLITSITKGRKEILAAVSRRRHKEIFLKDIEKLKLRGSCLDAAWHIRDLLGRGDVVQVATTSGPLIRLRRK